MTTSTFQQHAEKILAGLVLAALIFVGTAIYSMSAALQVVLNRLDTLDQKMSVMDVRFERYQTKEQARSDKEAQGLRDQIIEAQIQRVRESLMNQRGNGNDAR